MNRNNINIPKGRYWDLAWSLVDGCTPVSEACDHCWLRAVTHRFRKNRQWDFADVMMREDRLSMPLHRTKPKVFAIWSDLFHERVADEFIDDAMAIMIEANQHTYLILTKRVERMAEVMPIYYPYKHIWKGVTIENQSAANKRMAHITRIHGNTFLSIEPMIGPIALRPDELAGVDLVICGGESGHDARPMNKDWVLSLRDQCQDAGVPFFFKQWGNWVPIEDCPEDTEKRFAGKPMLHFGKMYYYHVGAGFGGRMIDGHIYNELPWVEK